MTYRLCFFLASCLAGLSVLFGAFMAHALKDKISDYYLGIFDTATRYQMYHAFALFIMAFLLQNQSNFMLQLTSFLFFIGTLIFCGSLYLLVFTKIKALGAITPIGGMCLILAWFLLAYSALKV